MNSRAGLLTLVWMGAALAAGQEEEVRVEVFSGGKFDPRNIYDESRRVIQAPWDGEAAELNDLKVIPATGEILMVGQKEGRAVWLRLSPDGRRRVAGGMLPEVIRQTRWVEPAPDGDFLAGGESGDGQLAVARLSGDGQVRWTHQVPGDRLVRLALAPDQSVLVSPAEYPFVHRIAADGSRLLPFGTEPSFRTDAANPAVRAAWWEGQGYPAAGYKRGVVYHRGGSAGAVALPDGTFVFLTTNFLYHPGGGPDFDPMMLRFDQDGKILWCTHLLQGLPAESDHKKPVMILDPHRGDLIVAMNQHGHFPKNLILTEYPYLDVSSWHTADIMIGWLARVDAATGRVKASTYYFPALSQRGADGKRRANSLFPLGLAVDGAGRVYVTGSTGHRLPTTARAFQPEPKGPSGFLSVFDAGLQNLLYSSLITETDYRMIGSAIGVVNGAAVVAGRYEPASRGARPDPWQGENNQVTDFLSGQSSSRGAFFGFYPALIPE